MRNWNGIARCDDVEGGFQMANQKNNKKEIKDFMIRVMVTTEEHEKFLKKAVEKGLDHSQ